MLRARLFGGMSVEVDGRPLPPIPGLKPRSLLAYLLLHPGTHPRSRLAGRFWPDVLETSARASLRSALWTVRGVFDEIDAGEYLDADRGGAGVASHLPRDVDTEQFELLLAAGDRAGLARAVALASAPLLADLSDDWVLEAQDAYRERVVQALARLADDSDRMGDRDGAVAWTRRALELERLSEATHRALMRRLVAGGERGQALAAYRRCKAILAAELGVAPSAETRELAEELRTATVPPSARERRITSASPTGAPSHRPAEREPLVGREAEVDELRRAWDEALSGRGGVVELEGEAGIGKSRLAAELGDLARGSGAAVAAGGALDLDGGPPFAPWSEALRDIVAASAAPPSDASWPSDLARLCPAVEAQWARRPAAPAGAPDLERARLFESVVEAISWCAGNAPLVIVLDDLHRADPASLALLAHVGRRLGTMPVLIIVTRRNLPRNDALDVALDAVERGGALRGRMRLGPLTDASLMDIVARAAPALDAAAADRVLTAAEGNPLLAREAARAAAAGHEPAHGLRAMVRASLARLDRSARRLVEFAAVAGRPLEPGEAAELVGAETLTESVEAAWETNLLEPGGRRVAFAHDLLSEACYREIPPAGLVALHGDLAAALARRPERSAAEIARHHVLAGENDAGRRYLATAAEEAQTLGALEEAITFLREALDLPEAGPSAQAELWLKVAGLEAWRGNRPRTDEAFDHALALLEMAGDQGAVASAWAERGRWLRTTLCFPREALEACRTALEILDRAAIDAPEARALALAGAAWAEAMAGDPARVDGLVAAVEAIAEVQGDRLLAGDLAGARAAALIRAGRFSEAELPSERAAALAREAGRPDLAFVALGNIACAMACRGDFARALDFAVQGRQANTGGLGVEMVHAAEAYTLSRLGRHEEALAAAEREAAVAAQSGVVADEATASFDTGVVLLAAGRASDAVDRLRGALATETTAFSRALARLHLADALVTSGDADGAEEELRLVPFEPIAAADLPETLVPRMCRVQGLVAAARGDHTRALKRFVEAEDGWRRMVADTPPGDLFAANLTDLGRPPVAGLVEPGVELGRVLADRAVVLAAAGRADEARAAAREAEQLADAMRFDGYRTQLENVYEKRRD